MIPRSLCMEYHILIVMGGLLVKRENGELVPKCYLHYYYHGKQRNAGAGSRMISPQQESPAHREHSLARGFVLFVV